PGSFVGSPTCTTVGTTGECTVTITSATAGTTVVSATTTLTVNSVVLTRSTGDANVGDGPNAQKIWRVPQTGQILPTNTECSDFTSGTSPALPGIFYSLNGAGKINQSINPGVFFYYTYVTTTVPNQVVTTS